MPDLDLERIIADLERRHLLLQRLPHESAQRNANGDETSPPATDKKETEEQ